MPLETALLPEVERSKGRGERESGEGGEDQADVEREEDGAELGRAGFPTPPAIHASVRRNVARGMTASPSSLKGARQPQMR